MALNPIVFTEKVVRSFLRYQLGAYPYVDEDLHTQLRQLLSLDQTRQSPLLKGRYVSLSRPFHQGAAIDELAGEGIFHPHMRRRIPEAITRVYGHQMKTGSGLASRGFGFNLLNAVRHRQEAQIVAAAGEQGRITIATNMAGRGTDIKLGRAVADLGGLHVIATERHESGRIDRQLFGRCARQGDPGSAQAFMSVDDELIRRFVPAQMRNRLAGALKGKMPGAGRLAETALYHAQRAAQRMAFRQRRNVLRMDTWMEEALSFSGPGSGF